MIWVDGEVVADDALAISALDRAFEHGLGLFETLRTWGGRAPLLNRHLVRLARSAEALGLAFDPGRLPTPDAVARLLDAQGEGGNRVLRITLSGGIGPGVPGRVWMRALPLPAPTPSGGLAIDVGAWRVFPDDPMARHKTLNYWSRRLAHERARSLGYDEAISDSGADGARLVWEGSRTSLFAVRDDRLLTPTTAGPIVPGVLRALVVETAEALGLEVIDDGTLSLPALTLADEVFLT
ncbi:MAG: aminotransferase class IV, partial [Thermoleophilia bacterium]|nr:aminotransferase class IV [Thermoleophilia bacterium]